MSQKNHSNSTSEDFPSGYPTSFSPNRLHVLREGLHASLLQQVQHGPVCGDVCGGGKEDAVAVALHAQALVPAIRMANQLRTIRVGIPSEGGQTMMRIRATSHADTWYNPKWTED